MKKPILSIIIPAYNVQPYVRACMNSIVAQSRFPEFEVIVVNDGSTDYTADIIAEEYMSRYPNIRLHNQKNAGVSAARNVGMSMAGGEYISFVDPDDAIGASYELCENQTYLPQLARFENMVLKEGYCPQNAESLIARRYDPEYFMRMIKIADDKGADIVLGNQITLDYTDVTPMLCILEYITNRVFDSSVESKKVLLKHSNIRKSANFAVYRRDFLEREKLKFAPGMQLDEDMLFCDLALMRADRVATTIKSGYLYKRHNGTLSTGTPPAISDLASVRRHLVLLDDVINRAEYREIFTTTLRWFNSWRTSMANSNVTQLFPYQKCTKCQKDTCVACETFPRLQKQIRRNIHKTLPRWEFTR